MAALTCGRKNAVAANKFWPATRPRVVVRAIGSGRQAVLSPLAARAARRRRRRPSATHPYGPTVAVSPVRPMVVEEITSARLSPYVALAAFSGRSQGLLDAAIKDTLRPFRPVTRRRRHVIPF